MMNKPVTEIMENLPIPEDDFFTGVVSEVPNNPIIKISSNKVRVGFWEFSIRKKKEDIITVQLSTINREAFLTKLNELGFFKRLDENGNLMFIREQNNILSIVDVPFIKDVFLNDCIHPIAENLNLVIQSNTYEFTPDALRAKYYDTYHLILNESFLHHLPEHTKNVLTDQKESSVLFFTNFFVVTTKGGWEKKEYSELGDYCIWEAHILKHSFCYVRENKASHFSKFIENISNSEADRISACHSGLGYLIHHHNKATGGQVVVLYDEKPAKKGKPEGGTGKGVFVNAIKQVRTTAKIDGKKYRSDDKFKWQLVKPTTQLVWLDDVNSKFPFEDLHSNSTDGWNIERKHEAEFFIPANESPKIVIASNTVLESGGTTNKRRQFILEFSDHYSKHIILGNEEPIKDEHGCTFFDAEDWDKAEWDRFYSFMIDCSVYYHKNGLLPYEHKNLVMNQLLQSTSEDFADWIQKGYLEFHLKYELKTLFGEFKKAYHLDDADITQSTFSKWLKSYASIGNFNLEKSNSNNKQFITLSKTVKK